MSVLNCKATRSNRNRAGAAIVEFALTLPIILFLLAALLEFSRAMLLKQTVDSAAYEGARAAVIVGSTPQAARDSVDALMTATRLKQWTTDIDPLVFDDQTSTITVRVAVSVADNSWITPFFFQGRIISSTVTLLTERPPAVQLTGIPTLSSKSNNLPSISFSFPTSLK